jgi:hypothetical protein
VARATGAPTPPIALPPPSGWPAAVQTDAPSANAASPSLLDSAEFPDLFAIAFDQPLVDSDGGRAVTLRFTPFAFAALRGAKPFGEPDPNARWGALRRVGLSATLGGPTQADENARSSRPRSVTNHLTAELKLLLRSSGASREDVRPIPPPSARDALGAVSLSLTADTYATGFGRDLYAATLIAESRRPPGLIANLGYRREERIHDRRREELKLGTGFGWRWLAASRRPLDVALSGDELIRNQGRASVRQANAKLDFTLTDALRLTSSVTFANHSERYAEGLVRVNAGLGFAFR